MEVRAHAERAIGAGHAQSRFALADARGEVGRHRLQPCEGSALRRLEAIELRRAEAAMLDDHPRLAPARLFLLVLVGLRLAHFLVRFLLALSHRPSPSACGSRPEPNRRVRIAPQVCAKDGPTTRAAPPRRSAFPSSCGRWP